MRAFAIPIEDLGAGDISAWRDLAAQAVEPNPFFEPEVVLPAFRHIESRRAAVLVVAARSGEWLACLPVRPSFRVRGFAVPVLSGWRHVYGCLGTPLVAPSALEDATEVLLDHALRRSRLRLIGLPWVGVDGPVGSALAEALDTAGRHRLVARVYERAVLGRATAARGVESLVGHGHLRNLRRLERRLAEHLDRPVGVRDESNEPGAVDRFLAVEASGWKGRVGTALACNEEHARFFRELCAGFRDDGRLQLLAYGGDGAPVSYKCNLLAGDTVFCFKIAHDQAFARYRPGLQLELRMVEIFRDEMTAALLDSCAAADSSLFEHFWPERRRIGSYLVARPTSVGGLTARRSARSPQPRVACRGRPVAR